MIKNITKISFLLLFLQIGSQLNAQVCWLAKDSVNQGSDSSAFVVYNYHNGLLTTLEYTDSAGQGIETTDSIIYGSNGKQSHIRVYDAGLSTLFRTTTLSYDMNDRVNRIHVWEDNGFGPSTIAHDILYNGSNQIQHLRVDTASITGTPEAFDLSFENIVWQNGNIINVDLIGDLIGLGTDDTIEFRVEYDNMKNIERFLPFEDAGSFIEQISSNNITKLITVNDEIVGTTGTLALDRNYTYDSNGEVSTRTENIALFTDNPSTTGFLFQCSGVGLEENEFSSFSIYPLPAKEEITIEADEMIFEIKLLSLNGQLVFKEQFATETATLSLSGIDSGLYIIEVIGDKKVSRTKVLVE